MRNNQNQRRGERREMYDTTQQRKSTAIQKFSDEEKRREMYDTTQQRKSKAK